MDLQLTASRVTTDAANYKKLDVFIEGVDEEDLLMGHYTIKDVIRIFGQDKVLDEIGEADVIKYFGIETI